MKVYLVAGKRTPFGKFSGSLQDVSPVDLAVSCSKNLMEQLHLTPEKIDHVIMGNVLPSTTDTLYGARHVALKLGCPESTPAYNVNRLCGSGIQAIMDSYRLIKLGEAHGVLACGSENMSLAPHLVYGGRFGTKYGPLKTVDMLMDSLTDQYAGCPMAITAENLAQEHQITRQQCDEFAASSHLKAFQAYEKGYLTAEIASLQIRKGMLTQDEHLREKVSVEEMGSLRPSFSKDGVVTAANASGIVDGAASVIVASEAYCEKNKLTPLAEICESAVVGVDPKKMGIGPVPAIHALLNKAEMSLADIDLIEINEAFAAQTLACAKVLGLDMSKLNIWGGAIALGHPLGASGVRISLTLSHQLKRENKKWGISSACIGGGQGIAMLLRSHS